MRVPAMVRGWGLLAAVVCVPLAAATGPGGAGPPSSRREIATRVAEWEARFGRAAVRLQRALLARCVAAGAELGTEVTILGEVVRAEQRYLGLRVETGLVFDHAVLPTPEARARAVWARVVAPALRDAGPLELSASGLWLELVSRHAPGGERETLLERLGHASSGAEHLHVQLGREAAAAVGRGGPQADEAARRALADVDGRPVSIVSGAPRRQR